MVSVQHIRFRLFRLSVPHEPDHPSVFTPRSSVGSRADAILPRSDLSVAPRFLWECLTNRIVSWVSAPAASNVACGFPALRSPVCFLSRVMRPIVLVQLSGEIRFVELDSR